MAALSVESASEGKAMGRPRSAAMAVKRRAELAVGGDAAGDEQAVRAVVLGGGEGLAAEVVDDGALEAGDEVEGLLVAESGRASAGLHRSAASCWRRAAMDCGHVVGFDVAEDGGLDAAEAEEEWALRRRAGRSRWRFGFDLREGEGYGAGVAVGGEVVDPGAAGVAEAEQLGDLVEGFAGGVVDGVADVAVVPGGVAVLARDRDGCGRRRRRARGAGRCVGRAAACSSSTAWMWPSRWLTAMSGLPSAKARALA